MKHFLMTLAFCISIHVNMRAQWARIIQVLDSQTDDAIADVHVILSGKVYKTGRDGKVKLILNSENRVDISHISYSDTSVVMHKSDSILRKIYLTPEIQNLSTTKISTRPREVFAPEKTNVFDFDWVRDTLYVLTYAKEKMVRKAGLQGKSLYLGCQLIRIDTNSQIIDTTSLPDYVTGFFHDPRDKLFIVCQSVVYLANTTKHSVQLIAMEKSEFETRIRPLNGVTVSDYFYDNYTVQFPEFTHFALDKGEKTETPIRTIRDDFIMELFRASYKYMSNYDKLRALKLELKTGIDKEIYAGFMTGFQQSPYYHPLYAPLFSQDDSMLIFDHHSGFLFFHDAKGFPSDSIAIDYQESWQSKFKDRIIQDPKSNLYYGLFERSGLLFIKPISIQTGNAGIRINLYYKYPERIKIRANQIYYLYRQTGSMKTKHLFAEPL